MKLFKRERAMGKFIIQQEQRKDVKGKERVSRESLGKYFYDLSKLTFGAMVLGIVMPWLSESENSNYLIILGLFFLVQ